MSFYEIYHYLNFCSTQLYRLEQYDECLDVYKSLIKNTSVSIQFLLVFLDLGFGASGTFH